MQNENVILGDRYLFKRKLGQGGSGSVYLCHDCKLHKEWAIKELKKSQDTDGSPEFELLKSVSCHVFPRIVDIVKTDTKIFLVMDYVEGITLKEKMRHQVLTETDVLPWAIQIASGILYLHQMSPSILYMDCKPDNIMVNDAGEIRMVDLGSAYICRSDREQRISGTRFFAPKEQRNSASDRDLPDVRTDIYAFGMTLYYLLTGGEREIRRNGRLRIKDINPKVSWGVSHIVEKCTMENPRQRYQSMEEVMEQLRQIHKVGRWKAGKERVALIVRYGIKVMGVLFGLLSAHKYQMVEEEMYLKLTVICLGSFMVSVFHKRVTIYETNRDVFCGTGKRILYLLFMVAGLLGFLHIPTYAAKEIGYREEVIQELDVTIYDSRGRKILIRDNASWGVEEDIIFVIPAKELNDTEGKISISYTNEEYEKEYVFECYKK